MIEIPRSAVPFQFTKRLENVEQWKVGATWSSDVNKSLINKPFVVWQLDNEKSFSERVEWSIVVTDSSRKFVVQAITWGERQRRFHLFNN